MFEDLLHGWDGEEVCLRFDEPTGAWMFVFVHSTVLGPAMGGTRLKVYDTPHEALNDGLRLSGAMTLKQAAADLPFGGGKAVVAVPEVPAAGERAAARAAVALRGSGGVDGGDLRHGSRHEHRPGRHGRDRRALPPCPGTDAAGRRER